MKKQVLKALVVAVGAAGLVAPRAQASSPATPTAAVRPQAAARTLDVALTQNRMLSGQVVDAQNAPQAGLPVSLRAEGKVIAQVTTDEQGRFQTPISRGGVYVVSAGGAERVVRTWTEETAPPSAAHGLLMVADGQAVRGQPGSWLRQNIIPVGLVGGFAGWVVAEAANNDERPAGS